jgi:tetratricopeptide (TPR) repeat protein
MARRAQPEKPWWKTATVIAGGLGALGAVAAALIQLLQPSTTEQRGHGHMAVTGDVNVTASGGGTTVMQTGPGTMHITHNYGISKEDYDRLREEFGVTDWALKSFFKILEQQQVPRADLDSTLRDIAKRYKALQEQLRAFTSDDPVVLALKQDASKALEAGDFAQAEELLNKASAKDLESARQLQETATKRRLSAAASKAENGLLKWTQLAYAEAATYYREAAEIVPKGSDDILAMYLHASGIALFQAGNYTMAEPLVQKALAIREQALGPEHPEVAQSLTRLATIYYTQRRYTEAEPLFLRALAIQGKWLTPERLSSMLALNQLVTAYRARDFILSLTQLAILYEAQGRYAEAEPLFLQVLTITEKMLGPEHPNVASSLNQLAELYRVQGRYAEAELLFLRALAIGEQARGPEQLYVISNSNRQAFAIGEQARGPEQSPVIVNFTQLPTTVYRVRDFILIHSGNGLAELYCVQGRYAEAEPLLLRAIAIREQALGPEHPEVAPSLSNLAMLYDTQGRYTEAEPLLLRALAIREQALGPEHPDVASSLRNLAMLYDTQGRYTEAEPLLLREIAIEEKRLGPEHPAIAPSLSNLARLYRVQGRYTEAEPLFLRALAITEKVLGLEAPSIALYLENYAALLRDTNHNAEADKLESRAKAIQASSKLPLHQCGMH